jgi:hypothetical protein
MAASKKPAYYRARHAFGVMYDGEQMTVNAGEIVSAGHPIMEGREEHFEPVENFGRWDASHVEQATAAPGEKRGEKPS